MLTCKVAGLQGLKTPNTSRFFTRQISGGDSTEAIESVRRKLLNGKIPPHKIEKFIRDNNTAVSLRRDYYSKKHNKHNLT